MSAEDLREKIEKAIGESYASGTDPDDIEAVLDAMKGRVEGLRAFDSDEVTA